MNNKIEILQGQSYLIAKLHQWVDEEKQKYSGMVEYEDLCWCNRNLSNAHFKIMDKIAWEKFNDESIVNKLFTRTV